MMKRVTRSALWLKSLLLVCSLFACAALRAQQVRQWSVPRDSAKTAAPAPDHDSAHYKSFPGGLVGRVYFSRKFTSFELERRSGSRLRYQPNTTLNMGVGFTYHMLTINLAYGFSFLNPENGRGHTKYLDLQTHFYARKWTIDVLGQFYKGYYLEPKGLAAPTPESYYIRPDIKIDLIGGAAYRLSNFNRFSYRAPMFQDEQQKKSAGSLLIGGEAYYGITKADSSVVPSALGKDYTQNGVRSVRFFKIGPGAGYAYNLIIASDFFCMASLQANLGVDFTHQAGGKNSANRVSLSPGYIYRFVLGYDKGANNVSFSVVGNQLNIKLGVSDDKIFITTGAYRLTYARR
ncbi:MAG: DUF4421 domain-containing protein, partial [Bacteroidetes bacterium]|nr:DUF4421 domain-containing protein [Bacteroidota bacterium]